MTDTNLLKQKIEESGYKMAFIADKMGISYYAFWNKANNRSEFKQSEIADLKKILHLTGKESDQIFFAQKVDDIST